MSVWKILVSSPVPVLAGRGCARPAPAGLEPVFRKLHPGPVYARRTDLR
jgi:hypothetical protein